MHRSEGDGALTDKAREEMEHEVRVLEAEDENMEQSQKGTEQHSAEAEQPPS